MIYIKKILLICFLVLQFFPVLTVQAQSTQNKLPVYNVGVDNSITDYLCTPGNPPDGRDLERCINRIYRFGISFGALVLVFFVVLAGYLYITGGESGKGKAKGILLNAFTGMAILLGSYAILFFINPELVTFKAIQPPIFNAPDLPSCEDIGFGANCVIVTDEDKAIESSGKGKAIECPDGIIDFDKKAIPVNQGNDTEKICKSLMEKLKQVHAKHKIVVNSTIRNGSAESQCHYSGNPKSGTCADLGPSSGNWDELCKAILSVGGMGFLNESAQSSGSCGVFVKTKNWSGAHLHVYLSTGGGGGGGTGSTVGGTRPNCIENKISPGTCEDGLNSGTRYQSGDFKNADPALQPAYNALKKKYPQISVNQVYRSPQYGAHMRSVFEAYALLNRWSESEVRSYGQYCQTTGIKYVTKSQVDSYDSKAKNWVIDHFSHHFSSLSSPMTCLSDHGSGIAFDLKNAPNTKAFEADAKALGLCHTVPRGIKANGYSMNDDLPHWALFAKVPGGQASCVSYATK